MKQKAFTLIELLVVVAIIGILAAVGVVAYNGYTKSAKNNATKSNIKLLIKKVVSDMAKCEIDGEIVHKFAGNTKKYTDCSIAFYNLQNFYKDIKSPYADATAKSKDQDNQLWKGNCCNYGKEGRTYYLDGNYGGQTKLRFLTYLSDGVVQEDFIVWPY